MAKILIVDDDETLSKLYINKLTSEGHQVTYAQDGTKAKASLAEQFDLIVLDLMIPKVDGMSLLADAKEGKYKKTPILVYTNLLSDEVKQKALSLGASEVLYKTDFTPFTFIDTIKKYISL